MCELVDRRDVVVMLLDVDVQSLLAPEDFRRQVEDQFPAFGVRAGSSEAQGGRYVSASARGGQPFLMKTWFYDDQPGRFSVQVSGDEPSTEGDHTQLASIRSFLAELGTVSDRA